MLDLVTRNKLTVSICSDVRAQQSDCCGGLCRSPVGAQLDKDKNYWRLLHRSHSEQDKDRSHSEQDQDSSTVDKKRGGQERPAAMSRVLR